MRGFGRSLERMHVGEPVQPVVLPIGITARAEVWPHVVSRSEGVIVRAWKLTGDDGITYYCKRVGRTSKNVAKANEPSERGAGHGVHGAGVVSVGVRLKVSDLQRSARFYEDVVGMAVTKATRRSISFGSAFAIMAAEPGETVGSPLAIFVNVRDIVECRKRLLAWRPEEAFNVIEKSGRRHVEVRDPDGHLVELYERGADLGRLRAGQLDRTGTATAADFIGGA